MQSISVGDIFWLRTDKASVNHPHVIVRLEGEKVYACQITTNRRKLNLPGNVFLEPGEAGLEKLSIVETSKLSVVELSELGDYVGRLDGQKLSYIIEHALRKT